jgi:beta-mannosidase
VLAPVALFATDEGANGVELCAVNDGPSAIEGMLTLTLLRDGAIVVAEAAANVLVPARGQVSVRADAVLPHFFDTAYAYRFGPQGFHALAGVLRRSDGVALAETVFFPGGLGVDREDLGLEATGHPVQGSSGIDVTLRCQRLSRDVAIEAVGYSSDDNYFHLLPGIEKTVRLTPHTRGSAPSRFTGSATALNAMTPTKVRLT